MKDEVSTSCHHANMPMKGIAPSYFYIVKLGFVGVYILHVFYYYCKFYVPLNICYCVVSVCGVSSRSLFSTKRNQVWSLSNRPHTEEEVVVVKN